MPLAFSAHPYPSMKECEAIAASASVNPFYCFSYVEARRLQGFEPYVFMQCVDGRVESGCTGFMRSGYLNRSLEIPSVPILPNPYAFWNGLLDFCSKARVSYLELNSFASKNAMVPTLRGEIGRKMRFEYLLHLHGTDLWDQLSSNHKRNIHRAQKAGIQFLRASNEASCHKHALLIEASVERRKGRGEEIGEPNQLQDFLTMTRSGAGVLFQAVLDGLVVSSVMVLLARRGAYYQSAGTSGEGMASGASHFLVYEIAKSLKAEAFDVFNLGGADQHSVGLERFKSGFGSEKVELACATYFLGGKLKKRLGTVVRLLRSSSTFLSDEG